MKSSKVKRSTVEEEFVFFMDYPDELNPMFTDYPDGRMSVDGSTDSGFSVWFEPSGDSVYWKVWETQTELLVADGFADSPQEAVNMVYQYV